MSMTQGVRLGADIGGTLPFDAVIQKIDHVAR